MRLIKCDLIFTAYFLKLAAGAAPRLLSVMHPFAGRTE